MRFRNGSGQFDHIGVFANMTLDKWNRKNKRRTSKSTVVLVLGFIVANDFEIWVEVVFVDAVIDNIFVRVGIPISAR